MSTTTPRLPISSRSPNQSPVSRGRDQKSPPQVGGTSTGCAVAAIGAETASAKARPIHFVLRKISVKVGPPRNRFMSSPGSNSSSLCVDASLNAPVLLAAIGRLADSDVASPDILVTFLRPSSDSSPQDDNKWRSARRRGWGRRDLSGLPRNPQKHCVTSERSSKRPGWGTHPRARPASAGSAAVSHHLSFAIPPTQYLRNTQNRTVRVKMKSLISRRDTPAHCTRLPARLASRVDWPPR